MMVSPTASRKQEVKKIRDDEARIKNDWNEALDVDVQSVMHAAT